MPEGSRSKTFDSSGILATTAALLCTVLQKFSGAAAYGDRLHMTGQRRSRSSPALLADDIRAFSARCVGIGKALAA